MANNNKLEYLSVTWNLIEGYENRFDNAVSNADDGESSTMDEGKDAAIDMVDDIISELQAFRMDIKRLSLKALKAKY